MKIITHIYKTISRINWHTRRRRHITCRRQCSH